MAYPKSAVFLDSEDYFLEEDDCVENAPEIPFCFVCGADLTDKPHGSCGLGHYCLKCSEEEAELLEYYEKHECTEELDL